MNSSARDTEPYEAAVTTNREVPSGVAWTLDVAGLSDQGKVRPNNEDHFLIMRFGRFLETVGTNVPASDIQSRYDDVGYAMVTADGLGGHASGQDASRLAIKYLVDLVIATPDWVLRVNDERDANRIIERNVERFERASEALTHEAELKPRFEGFGTTLTLAAVLSNELFVFHVGDSRAYLLRGHRLHQLTHDHTRAQELVDAGLIRQADVATHRWRNCLTRLLGDQVIDAHPDVQRLSLEAEDVLLLCSDGLTDMVDEAKITEVLESKITAADMCRILVDQALEAGGRDNITVIVARWQPR